MILVFGQTGQVAQALSHTIPEARFLNREEAPFEKADALLDQLNKYKPSLVINAVAYTKVDLAESDLVGAEQINSVAPGVIARWCQQNDACLIHFSTDYVFDGSGNRPWLETDVPNPINAYGRTKLEGEKAIQASGCRHFIFRIAWVYSPWGHNFKKTIFRLAQEREELRIVSDQIGSPTDARDVASFISRFLKSEKFNSPELKSGIYHLTFAPFQSWYDFACTIVEEAKQQGHSLKVKRIVSIRTDEYPTPAKRPLNSRLGTLYDLMKSLK